MLKLQFTKQKRDAMWLIAPTFSIGSNKENNLVIQETSVAEFHTVIAINSQGKLTLKNLSENHKTSVNNAAITHDTSIVITDTIQIGDIELRVIEGKDDPNTIDINEKKVSNDTWRLVAHSSWLIGKEYPINGKMTLGRDADCDIMIPGNHLSRCHAEISNRGTYLFIKDLESSNGTFINGQRVTESEIYHDDELRFDKITFIVKSPRPDSNKTIIRTAKKTPKTSQPKARVVKEKPIKPNCIGNRTEDTQQAHVSRVTYWLLATLLIVSMSAYFFQKI